MTLTRRQMLLALAALPACTKKDPPASAAPPVHAAKLSWPRTTKHAGVEMIELFPQDADEESPLVVAIHGMGDRPENWVDGWKEFPVRAQVVLPRAFTPWAGGFSWFKIEDGMTDADFGPVVSEAETKLWPAILEVAAGRKVIVTGFSQGGILSFTMAARHADVVRRAFPVAGACPTALWPKSKAAPVLAFHGTADPMLPIDWARKTVAGFFAHGNEAELKEYPGVGHTISTNEREDWMSAVLRAVKAA